MSQGMIRTRWAAIGAAIAVTLGGGGLGLAYATTSTGERAIYLPIQPCRLVDTRPSPDTVGPRATPLGAGETFSLAGWGTVGNCVLPTGTAGLALNVTAVGATLPTFLTFWPSSEPRPLSSNLNPSPGQPPTPNAVNVDLSPAGQFSVFNLAGSVNLIVDVVGIYDDHNHDDRYYTKAQVDSLIAPLHNSVAAFAGGDQLIDLGATEVVVRSVSLMPPANGAVIVNSSAHLFRISGTAGARCSITTGTAIDYNFLQMADMPDVSQSAAVLAGTRGYSVAKGVLFTANLVCDQYLGDVRLQDSAMTAIFAPS
jgi:hypothetical protein